MKGFVELWKKSLKLPIFIGLPVSHDEFSDASISDPVFASVIGTMILSNKYSSPATLLWFSIVGFIDSIVNTFKKLLP